MATSKNVIPAPIFIGINSNRNPQAFEITGLPAKFTPYLIRGGSNKLRIIRDSLIMSMIRVMKDSSNNLY